ncbi:MAG TPA: hypothetical protein VJW76_11615, partial [Verrucomicrobiae bacterium]|nr:hypothetical protein [Verrucomicrobiae bacterium]
NVTWGIGLLDMTGSSTITGAFTLTVSTGSVLRYNHSSTIPGSVTVDGTLQLTSSSVTLVINGLLTLNAGGTLNNPGTIQVGIGEFINNGGTIIGNPPQQIGGTSTALQISGIQIIGSQASSLQKAQAVSPSRDVLISWSGRTRQGFVIETSTDLGRWKEASVVITEIAPGAYQGRLTTPVEGQQFFRVRLAPRDPPERRFDRPYQLH